MLDLMIAIVLDNNCSAVNYLHLLPGVRLRRRRESLRLAHLFNIPPLFINVIAPFSDLN